MTDEDKVNTELFARMQRLRELRIEHRDLDDVICRLSLDLYVDELQLSPPQEAKAPAQGPDPAARERADPGPQRMIERTAALFATVKIVAGNPQFPVIAATALLVTVGVLWGRRWYLGQTNGHSHSILTDALAVVVPYLGGLVILGLALFAAAGEPRPWYETAAMLLALLALIRLATFLRPALARQEPDDQVLGAARRAARLGPDRGGNARLARPGGRPSSTRSA